MKEDDELYLIFCNPVTAIDFLGEDDAAVIENSIVMSPVIPEGEVTLVKKDEFLKWLKGEKMDDLLEWLKGKGNKE